MLRTSLRRNCATVVAIPTEYVPKPRPGRNWTAPSNILKQQQSSSSTTSTKHALPFTPANQKSSSVFAQGTATFRETEAAVQHYETKLKAEQRCGWFYVPQADYDLSNGISPVMSATQAQLLRDVHHAGIVKRLNELTVGTQYEGHPLDAVLLATSFDAENAAIHTAACEHWNHSFAWRSMLPFGSVPSARLREALVTSPIKQLSETALLFDATTDGKVVRDAALASLNGIDKVRRCLVDACRDAAASGGGWVFLVTVQAGQQFEVVRYRPGSSPLTSQLMPLVAINMQYHARYVDYPDDGFNSAASTQQYIENSLRAVNWKVAEHFWRMAQRGGSE